MSVIRVGSSSTYASGWDEIFGGGARRTGTKKVAGKATVAKAAKKSSRAARKKAKRRS